MPSRVTPPVLSLFAYLLSLLIVAYPCRGQMGVMYEEPLALTARELAGFDRTFSPLPAQHEAAAELTNAANAELKRQEERGKPIYEAWQAVPPERRTPEARARVRRDLAAVEPDIKGVRAALLADLRALLDAQQQEKWQKFEFFLRREKWQSHHNGWNGEKTNLLGLVGLLALDPPSRSAVSDLLDRYERELDPILTDLERGYEGLSKSNMEIWQKEQQTGESFADERRAAGAEHAAAAHRLIVLNDSFAQRLAALLPDETAKAFRTMYEHATLTEAYGLVWRWQDEAIRAAPDLEGVDEATRETLRRVVHEYAARYDQLTAQIAVMERSIRSAVPGEAVAPPEWDPERLERSDLLGKTQLRLRDLLPKGGFERMVAGAERKQKEWDDAMSR